MATKANEKAPLVISGSVYLRDRFVSKRHVARALEETGHRIAHRLPKDGNVRVALGRTLGKKKTTALAKAASSRGFETVDISKLLGTARNRQALAKVLRANEGELLKSETALLAELTPKKKSA